MCNLVSFGLKKKGGRQTGLAEQQLNVRCSNATERQNRGNERRKSPLEVERRTPAGENRESAAALPQRNMAITVATSTLPQISLSGLKCEDIKRNGFHNRREVTSRLSARQGSLFVNSNLFRAPALRFPSRRRVFVPFCLGGIYQLSPASERGLSWFGASYLKPPVKGKDSAVGTSFGINSCASRCLVILMLLVSRFAA